LTGDFHEEKITGEEKTVDGGSRHLQPVNSAATKLSKGDWPSPRNVAQWPEARAAMRTHLESWEKEGYAFSLDWLLRNTTAVITGRAEFRLLGRSPGSVLHSGARGPPHGNIGTP